LKLPKTKQPKPPKPLIKLTLIVVPTIVIVCITILLLYLSGIFTSAEDKTIGSWERTRQGTYSFETYKEEYVFNHDGTGKKTVTDKDGYSAETKFTWCITAKKTLVMNGHVKYYWNSGYADYFDNSDKTAKKYWYVTKNNLYLGEDTSAVYELYEKND